MPGPWCPHRNSGQLLWPSPRYTRKCTNNSKDDGITILREISISVVSNLLDIHICGLKLFYIEDFFFFFSYDIYSFISRGKIHRLAIFANVTLVFLPRKKTRPTKQSKHAHY